MNKELIMRSDVLDIIFEKRNKAYGAYTLRKFYHNRLIKSLGLMFAVVVILSAFTFLPEKKFYNTTIVDIPLDPVMGHTKPPEKIPPAIKAPQKPTTPQVPAVLTLPVIVNNTVEPAVKTIVDSGAIVIRTDPGIKDPGTGISGPSGPGPAVVTDPVTAKVTPDRTIPVYGAEVMPQFPGGMDALHRFLERNLNNPKDLEDGNMVSVKVQFVVGYDGKLQRFQIIQDGGEAFNNEVMRVLKKMPEWIPGRSNGENVSVYYTIPVKFVPAE